MSGWRKVLGYTVLGLMAVLFVILFALGRLDDEIRSLKP